jgi:hypothetical protein
LTSIPFGDTILAMGTYDDFEREVMGRQHQMLTELCSPAPSVARVGARRRGHRLARLLRSMADRLDPDSSRDLTPASPR